MNTFLLPDLGEGLTEGEIVRWLVKVGELKAGQIKAEDLFTKELNPFATQAR